MFTNKNLVKEILNKKKHIIKKSDLYNYVEDQFNGSLDREALQHSLRIEYPVAEALSEKNSDGYKKEFKRSSNNLKKAWAYGKKNFKMPLKNDFLTELAYKIDPEIFENGKGYRMMGVRPSGSKITPPYPAKLKLCMGRFFDALDVIYNNCNKLKREGNTASEKCFDIGSWMHLHLARIHPFEDVNGRTSRMINNLYLKQSNAFPPIIIQEGERKDYHQHMENAIIGIRERDGEKNGNLILNRDNISEGEKGFYDFMAGKLNIALDKIMNKN